ncbi:UDP-N-acetylglucosamine 2-epimerase (non-hydrolyzing) [Pseudodesulfovibrio sp. JC047]|uniref:non-hydrolyzing UDP-N-acetylglucosamine 2-epimerase n=1 Tax=Pseudodesulfovibrio sp. JC047 TaxID=2683199 RepID=UPI0013D67D9C|nr:UDP-N-acetylglucosamine 2-epimerase (non-hydrolyzing) [Pseudodesulfovibrio sp. JC047]NDV20629.1 UDP-N-acetylglucosamine 2-epimerase (non-hydrolyzing) [Pseudodesulfovibrio sp. JC047]
MRRIHLIIAARPNLIKMAPVYHAVSRLDGFEVRLIHTGQHYDTPLSAQIIRELNLPQPDHNFAIGSGTHAQQTAGVMLAYEKLLREERPDLCVVPGDVNSTLACALTAAKQQVPVAHLEAGLRSRDMTMPEEINRILTDRISSILWTPSEDADTNLLNEGVDREKIFRVGNCMIDSLVTMLPTIRTLEPWKQVQCDRKGYSVVTLHRPGNVDSPDRLKAIVHTLITMARRTPLVMPLHPRTQARLEACSLLETLRSTEAIRVIEPLGYLEFIALVEGSQAIITDSGGIQEETSYLNIPCLTLRPNTERPITCTLGTNRLVDLDSLETAHAQAVGSRAVPRKPIPLWDGKAGMRIAKTLTDTFFHHEPTGYAS